MELEQYKSAVEAILFALGEPVSRDKLAETLEILPEEIEETCRELALEYERRDSGLRLIRMEDSWQMVSAPRWGDTVKKVLTRKKPDKLSPAAMETLSVVAYFQPVTRVYIDQVRGVDSSHSLSLLIERELVAPCGTLDVPGRPILYETTPAFLRAFGLSSLEELPPLPEQEKRGDET